MRYNEELQRSWMRVASLSRKMLKQSRHRKRPRMQTSEARAAGETSRPLSLDKAAVASISVDPGREEGPNSRTMLHQLSAIEYGGRLILRMPNRTMNPPIIQLFHALGCAAAPYTQGETKNHTPASKQIVPSALIAPNLVLSPRVSIPVAFVCSFGVISVAFL